MKKVRYRKGGAVKEMNERYAVILVNLGLVDYVEEKVETVIRQSPVTKVIGEGSSSKPKNTQFKGK